MKQFFSVVLFGSVFFLSGCFGSGEDTQETKNLENITEYAISVPQDWEIFPSEEYPKSVVFSAREPLYSSRIPAILAISKEHSRPQSLEQFIQRNLEEIRQNSQDFKQVNEEDVSTDLSVSRLIEYQERRSADNSNFGVYSLYSLPNNIDEVYVVTLLFDGNIDTDAKENLKKIVLSFAIKEKKEENVSE